MLEARVGELSAAVRFWRQRAEAAESELAVRRLAQTGRAWRLVVALQRVRQTLAPTGSVRARLLGAAFRPSPARVDARESAASRRADRRAVLFLSGSAGDSMRYRCEHRAEQLRLLGATVDAVPLGDADLGVALKRYQCFVLHRVPWSDDLAAFRDRARALGKSVVFDTDDLIFEPETALELPFLGYLSADMERQRRTMREADAGTVSTEFLAERARAVNRSVRVVFNAVSDEMTYLAERALAAAPARLAGDVVTIAYLSGSPTHQRDFEEAADALSWCLDTYPQARLLTIGHLAVDPRFERFGSRVETMPFQHWWALPRILVRVDVTIAPLERDLPFAEAKSAVKYLESGLMGVPTIASPRGDFVRVIESGVNGLLADGPEAWREALAQLVESPSLRREIGRRARDDVYRHHTTRAGAAVTYEAFAALARRVPRGAPLTIEWFSPRGDGHAAAAQSATDRLAEHLDSRGHRLVRPGQPEETHTVGGLVDVSVATDWRTAFEVAERGNSLLRCYLIDELDGAAAVRDEPSLARSFDLPLLHICIGRDLAAALSAATRKPARVIAGDEGPDGTASQLEEYLLEMAFLRAGPAP
jgi:glycosyltransferase involved in cell wall biosynthesis